jgi:hypothetical protein
MTATKKYGSHSAFQYGVVNVNERLTDGERMVLYALAVAADYKAATSHPGNSAMGHQSNRSERGVRDIIQRLIAKGLIERLRVGDGGRGLATEYRIRVEDDRFPKPGSNRCRVIKMKAGSNDCHVSGDKRGSGAPETRQLDGVNPAVWTATHPINPSQPPSVDGGGGLVSPENLAAEKIINDVDADNIFDQFETVTAKEFGTPITLSKQLRATIAGNFGDATENMIHIALRRIINRKQGWEGLKSPQSIVLAEFPAVLRSLPKPPTPEELEAQQARDQRHRDENERWTREQKRDSERRNFLHGQGLNPEETCAAMIDPTHHLWAFYDDPPVAAQITAGRDAK